MKAELIAFLAHAGLFSSILFVPLFANELGASSTMIGLIVAAYSASVFISSYIFGRLADVHGRRLFLRAGLLLSGLAFVIQFFAFDSASLLLVRVLVGFCAGIFPAALLAYAYESNVKINRFLSFGSAGWGFGTVIGGVMATYFTLKSPFLVSAILFFCTFVISLKIKFAKDVRLSVPFFPKAVIKKNLAVYLAVLVRHTGACAIWVIFPIFIYNMGGNFFWMGVVYAINSFTQFIVMMRLKGRSTVLIQWGLALSIVTFLSFTFCKNIWVLMPTQVFLGCSWALIYVGSVKFIMARNVERATATGMLDSTTSMSAILGSLIGGFTVDLTGGNYLAPMYLAAGMGVISLVLFYILKKKEDSVPEQQ
jgi:DHA1 family quinolone resistance protein-like MFS transporter